jgi:hypothetical protein
MRAEERHQRQRYQLPGPGVHHFVQRNVRRYGLRGDVRLPGRHLCVFRTVDPGARFHRMPRLP